jgi:Mce-associated membrane protein
MRRPTALRRPARAVRTNRVVTARAVRTHRVVTALAVATLALATLAGYAWYGLHAAQRRDRMAHACVVAATPAAQAVFSYDYRTFDASVANGRSFITGAFADEYAKTTAGLKATAVKDQAIVQAQVSAVSVVDTSGGKVDVLMYLNQYRRNANVTGEKVDQDRVVLTMVPVGKDCKVSAASAI